MKRGAIRTRCVEMAGPDTQMDTLGDSYYDSANPLPIKCPHCAFPDLDFVAKLLHPAKLDFHNYRRGKVPYLEGEQAEIDGVMFASTDHGDAFVLDVSAKNKDHPVYWHDHEQNTLEPFAPNFAACIKRFAEKN